MTPFFVNYGFEPDLPSTLGATIWEGNLDAQQRARRLKNIIRSVRENIAQAQECSADHHDAGRTEITFQPGDKVLISRELATPEYLRSPEGKKSL
ncbi:hypothetical protein GGH96_006313, partial [Coemansia sp. RSA 1972]